MKNNPDKILVVRNDKLGDFMLAWPAFNVAKDMFPDAEIWALVPEYTRPMAEICPWISGIVIDNQDRSLRGSLKLAKTLKQHNFDACVFLYSEFYTALAAYAAGIAERFAPATKLSQIFFNHRFTQRRSKSKKPEYQYNIDLVYYMGNFYETSPIQPKAAPYLVFSTDIRNRIKNDFINLNNIKVGKKLIFVHAGSGGSASNLSLEQYAKLIHLLSKNTSLFFVLTAGPGETQIMMKLSDMISNVNHTTHTSLDGLLSFSKLLAIADTFISGSTGVLHIAGALNVPTVAFYPTRKSATSLRWKTLNSEHTRLAFSPDQCNSSDSMDSMDLTEISSKILKKYFDQDNIANEP